MLLTQRSLVQQHIAPRSIHVQKQPRVGRPCSRQKQHRHVCRAERQERSQREIAGDGSGGSRAAGTAAATKHLAAATLALTSVGLLQPGAALAAHTASNWHSMYNLSLGVGAACTVLTLLSTSRFLMSFFPELERKAAARRLPWAVLSYSLDPFLRPLQHGLFKMEPGDLNYGAVALLAVTVSVLESLVGEGGLWLDRVPDLDLLHYLQYMVFFGHSLLLPSWVLVILRSFWII